MKIHKETIASELQLLMDGVNSKEQTVEEIVAYIRWRDKQLTIPVVVGQSEQLLAFGWYMMEHSNVNDGKTAKDYLEDFLSQ